MIMKGNDVICGNEKAAYAESAAKNRFVIYLRLKIPGYTTAKTDDGLNNNSKNFILL